jgi:hypothetical protein
MRRSHAGQTFLICPVVHGLPPWPFWNDTFSGGPLDEMARSTARKVMYNLDVISGSPGL